MAITSSYQNYLTVPSAILSDGLLPVPLWAVTSMQLAQAYHMPPIGSSGARAIVGTHDDTITLTAQLVGAERYAWKFALETLAETARRGGALESWSGGLATGLILVTSMTIRTDLQVQAMSFTASAAKRDVLDVSMTLVHMPRPSALGKLLDVASIGIGALADFGGN